MPSINRVCCSYFEFFTCTGSFIAEVYGEQVSEVTTWESKQDFCWTLVLSVIKLEVHYYEISEESEQYEYNFS